MMHPIFEIHSKHRPPNCLIPAFKRTIVPCFATTLHSAAFFFLLIAPVLGGKWQTYFDQQKSLNYIEHGVVPNHDDGSIKALTFGSPISQSEARAGARSFDTFPNELKQTGLFYGNVHYDVYSVVGDHIYGTSVGEALVQVKLDGYVLAVCCIGHMVTCQPHAEEIADWLRHNSDN